MRRGTALVVALVVGLGLTACEPVDVGPGGATPNGPTETAVISDNGRFVAFVSRATNLVSGDTNRVADVFVRDRQSGATQRVSTTGTGGQLTTASGGSTPCSGDEGGTVFCEYGPSTDTRSLAISDDGRFVAFLSGTPGPQPAQVYVKDRSNGALLHASRNAAGAAANGHSYALELSGNGARLAFWSSGANLGGPNSGEAGLFSRSTTGSAGPTRVGDGSGCAGGITFLDGCNVFGHDFAPTMTDDGSELEFTTAIGVGPTQVAQLLSGDGATISYRVRSFQEGGTHSLEAVDFGRYRRVVYDGQVTELPEGSVEAAAKDVSGDGRLVVTVAQGRAQVQTAPGALVVRHRVNAGGGAYDGPLGPWSADRGFQGGSTFTTDQDVIDPAGDARVAKTERWGMTGYRLAVPNGRHRVRLHFAEISPCCTDEEDRIFDVRLEGALVLDDFDPGVDPLYGHEFGDFVARRFEFVTTVTDGFVDVRFERGVQQPNLSAIEVMDAR